MVIFVTVWSSVSLKEARCAQLHLTRHTHKVFRVPHFTQRCDHLQIGWWGGLRASRTRRVFEFELFCLVCSGWCSIFFMQISKSTVHRFNACPFVYVSDYTFPTMLLLQEAQWPLAVVRTPIFSKSELSPPSSSSIESVFLLVVEAFAWEPAVLLLLLSLFSCCSSSVFLFTDCFCVSGGGVVEDTGS